MLGTTTTMRAAVAAGITSILSTFVNSGEGAIVYGNYNGTDVSFDAVTEVDNQLPGPVPSSLYGAPNLSGNSLLFDPFNFDVAVNGGANELQDGRLTMNVAPENPGKGIKMISLTEGGGWSVNKGTSATVAGDSLLINSLFITSVNGVSVNPIAVPPTITFTDTNNGSASVTKTSDSIKFSSDGGLSSGSWNAISSFNLSAAEQNAGLTGNITGLSLSLDNQLSANSEANSTAFIDKKFFDVTASTSIPEPVSAIGLLLFGCGGLLWRPARAKLQQC